MTITSKIKQSPDLTKTSLSFTYEPIDENLVSKHLELLNSIARDESQPVNGLFIVMNMKMMGQDKAILIASRWVKDFDSFVDKLNLEIPRLNEDCVTNNMLPIPEIVK